MLGFPENLAGIFDELCVIFVKSYQCSLTTKCSIKQRIKQVYVWTQLNFGRLYALLLHMLLKLRRFFTVVHTAVYCGKLDSLTVKKVHLYQVLLLLYKVFSEFFEINFNPVFLKNIEVGLKRFFIYALEMLAGALSKQSKLLTHCSGDWGPLWKQTAYTLQLLLGALQKQSTYTLNVLLGTTWKATCLYIAVAFGPLWKQGAHTLQLLLGAPLKA